MPGIHMFSTDELLLIDRMCQLGGLTGFDLDYLATDTPHGEGHAKFISQTLRKFKRILRGEADWVGCSLPIPRLGYYAQNFYSGMHIAKFAQKLAAAGFQKRDFEVMRLSSLHVLRGLIEGDYDYREGKPEFSGTKRNVMPHASFFDHNGVVTAEDIIHEHQLGSLRWSDKIVQALPTLDLPQPFCWGGPVGSWMEEAERCSRAAVDEILDKKVLKLVNARGHFATATLLSWLIDRPYLLPKELPFNNARTGAVFAGTQCRHENRQVFIGARIQENMRVSLCLVDPHQCTVQHHALSSMLLYIKKPSKKY